MAIAMVLVVAGCVTTASRSKVNHNPKPQSTDRTLHQIGYITGDSNFSHYQTYFRKVYESIADQWTMLAEQFNREHQSSGARVIVDFVLTGNGTIGKVQVDFSSANPAATMLCEDAIRNRSPYDAWPSEMLEALGPQQTVRITFIYR